MGLDCKVLRKQLSRDPSDCHEQSFNWLEEAAATFWQLPRLNKLTNITKIWHNIDNWSSRGDRLMTALRVNDRRLPVILGLNSLLAVILWLTSLLAVILCLASLLAVTVNACWLSAVVEKFEHRRSWSWWHLCKRWLWHSVSDRWLLLSNYY